MGAFVSGALAVVDGGGVGGVVVSGVPVEATGGATDDGALVVAEASGVAFVAGDVDMVTSPLEGVWLFMTMVTAG